MYKSIPYSKSIIVLLQVRMALYLLLLLTATNSTGAQEPGCEVHNKKAERLFNSAGDMLKSGKPKEAYEYLIEAVREDPEYAAANYELAYINYNKAKSGDVDINNLKKRDQFFNLAVDYFTASIGLCPSIDDYKAHLYLGEMLYSKNDYVNAKHHLEAYVSKSKYYAEGKRQARSMLDKINAFAGLLNNPVPFNPKVVKGVSTSRDEFLPLVSPDGQYMFYTQRFMEKQKFSEVEKYQENFTISERISDYESEQDVFTKGKPMPLPFNDGRNQGGTAITIDNNHIYITICEQVKLPVNMRTATNNVYEN
ncbi:MAG: tetratricopeptide repeat protein, partial [Bacteroidetes bacterium]|nr:tetratricopeptide repeat protein [Bacteroidota bacterium]